MGGNALVDASTIDYGRDGSKLKMLSEESGVHVIAGAPIWLHTEAGTMCIEMLDILEEEGVDLTKVGVGHSDCNANPYYHLQLVSRGAYVQFDGVSKVKYYPASVRVELIHNLIDHGHIDQLLVSGDMGRQSYLKSYGGGSGFEFIIQKSFHDFLTKG